MILFSPFSIFRDCFWFTLQVFPSYHLFPSSPLFYLSYSLLRVDTVISERFHVLALRAVDRPVSPFPRPPFSPHFFSSFTWQDPPFKTWPLSFLIPRPPKRFPLFLPKPSKVPTCFSHWFPSLGRSWIVCWWDRLVYVSAVVSCVVSLSSSSESLYGGFAPPGRSLRPHPLCFFSR